MFNSFWNQRPHLHCFWVDGYLDHPFDKLYDIIYKSAMALFDSSVAVKIHVIIHTPPFLSIHPIDYCHNVIYNHFLNDLEILCK